MTMERLGTVYMNMEKFAEAKEILNTALNICERKFGTNNNTTADIIYDIGCITFADALSGCGGVDQQNAERKKAFFSFFLFIFIDFLFSIH